MQWRRLALRTVFLAGIGFGAGVACGSSDDTAADDDDDGPGTTNSDRIDSGGDGIDLLDPDGTVHGTRVYQGGMAELSSQEIDAMESAACTGWAAEPEGIPAMLMMVVDTSQSMQNNAPGSQASKWSLTAAALHHAVDALPPSMPVGLMFYPNRGLYTATQPQADLRACIDVGSLVPVERLGANDQLDRLHAAIDEAGPGGCTPTHGAYVYGLMNGLRPSTYLGDRYMLLITDGQPTLSIDCMGACNPAEPVPYGPIVDEIGNALASDGTRTFIIGSPGSEENETTGEDVRGWLSLAARTGGTATASCSDSGPIFCHFDMSTEQDFGQGLQRALAAITGQIVSCSYAIPAPPPGETVDPDLVNLVAAFSTGSKYALLRSSDSSCSEGWFYDEEGHVALCADSCDLVRSDAGAALRLLFGCEAASGPVR